MKSYKKLTKTQKTLATLALIITFPIWVWLVLAVFIWAFYLLWAVYRPIVLRMREQPLYWLNWHEVKRLSGKTSYRVLDCLTSGTRAQIFQCRYRDQSIVEKLRRRRHFPRSVLPATGPIFTDNAIFYEFRLRDRGGKRHPKWLDLFSSFAPVPTLQPAYAS